MFKKGYSMQAFRAKESVLLVSYYAYQCELVYFKLKLGIV